MKRLDCPGGMFYSWHLECLRRSFLFCSLYHMITCYTKLFWNIDRPFYDIGALGTSSLYRVGGSIFAFTPQVKRVDIRFPPIRGWCFRALSGVRREFRPLRYRRFLWWKSLVSVLLNSIEFCCFKLWKKQLNKGSSREFSQMKLRLKGRVKVLS